MNDLSESTRALIQRYYEAFNAGDVGAMLDCLSDDVVHHVNEGAARVGKAKFEAFCGHMNERYGETLTDIVVMASPDGERAAAEFVVNGTYLTTDDGLPEARGQVYVLAAGGFFSVQDARITRLVTYYNLADWVRQVSQ